MASHGAAAEEEGLEGFCEEGGCLPLNLEVLTEDEQGRIVVAVVQRLKRRENDGVWGRERVLRSGSSEENLAVVRAIFWGLSCIVFQMRFECRVVVDFNVICFLD